jgi:TetR/AcrR family transcriptional regulator, fatty acid metabolism regulator protein
MKQKTKKRAAAKEGTLPKSARKPAARGPTKGEKTQARLVEAAIEEFYERGFHAARVSGIVARAKVTQPAFYLYFSSKEKIHGYLVQRVRSDLINIIKGAQVPPALLAPAARGGIRSAIEVFLQYFADNPKLATIGYFNADASASIRAEITLLVARNVAAEQAAGYFRKDLDTTFVAECYCGSVDRLITRYLLNQKEKVSTLGYKIADIYFAGVLQGRDGA